MKKIPTIFKRDPNKMSLVLNEINPICQWVFAGEGVATRKYDGTCVAFINNICYKRHTIKAGKPIPHFFIKADFDPNTDKTFGWVPLTPNDKYHNEAIAKQTFLDGTYELVGPKIQGNPENFYKHTLIAHSSTERYTSLEDRTFEGIKTWLVGRDIEGLVFHHPDGRMAKIKLRDFGLKRGEKL